MGTVINIKEAKKIKRGKTPTKTKTPKGPLPEPSDPIDLLWEVEQLKARQSEMRRIVLDIAQSVMSLIDEPQRTPRRRKRK